MIQQRPLITMNSALEIMETGKPIASIGYIKHNVSKKTGGEYAELTNVVLCGSDWKNATRIVRPAGDPETEDLKEFHIRLMISFNGRKVIW